MESPDKQNMSPGQVTVCTGRGSVWCPAAQLKEHLMHDGEVMDSMPSWVSQTFFRAE